MALKLMHRGEIHVDLSRVCDKQQQQPDNNVCALLGKETLPLIMMMMRARARDLLCVCVCVLWKWTEIGIDFSLHENCECREIGADMRIFIAFGSDCSVGGMAKRLRAAKESENGRKSQSTGERERKKGKSGHFDAKAMSSCSRIILSSHC